MGVKYDCDNCGNIIEVEKEVVEIPYKGGKVFLCRGVDCQQEFDKEFTPIREGIIKDLQERQAKATDDILTRMLNKPKTADGGTK
jgi:hypothetical protein